MLLRSVYARPVVKPERGPVKDGMSAMYIASNEVLGVCPVPVPLRPCVLCVKTRFFRDFRDAAPIGRRLATKCPSQRHRSRGRRDRSALFSKRECHRGTGARWLACGNLEQAAEGRVIVGCCAARVFPLPSRFQSSVHFPFPAVAQDSGTHAQRRS